MTVATIKHTMTIEVIEGGCGDLFGMTRMHLEKVEESGDWFWCPRGHRLHFVESDLDRQRKRAEQAEADSKRLKGELDGALDKLNATKKRANGGMCPHCRRSFKQVRRHIKSKHPDKTA